MPGSFACAHCAAGQHQPRAGRPSCRRCDVGQYQPPAGKVACVSCGWAPAGEAPRLASLDGRHCLEQCPAGRFATAALTGKHAMQRWGDGREGGDGGSAAAAAAAAAAASFAKATAEAAIKDAKRVAGASTAALDKPTKPRRSSAPAASPAPTAAAAPAPTPAAGPAPTPAPAPHPHEECFDCIVVYDPPARPWAVAAPRRRACRRLGQARP